MGREIRHLLLAMGWISWAVAGSFWLRLGMPLDNWPDTIAAWCLGALHGLGVGWLTAIWQDRWGGR